MAWMILLEFIFEKIKQNILSDGIIPNHDPRLNSYLSSWADFLFLKINNVFLTGSVLFKKALCYDTREKYTELFWCYAYHYTFVMIFFCNEPRVARARAVGNHSAFIDMIIFFERLSDRLNIQVCSSMVLCQESILC
jgi:hypothetical protein